MATRDAIQTALGELITQTLDSADVRGFDDAPDRPSRIPNSGAVVLTNVTEPQAPNVDLGLEGPLYNKTVLFTLEVLGSDSVPPSSIASQLGVAIAADRTLGGASEWTEIGDFDRDDETDTGSEGHRVGRIAVTAEYTTDNPAA